MKKLGCATFFTILLVWGPMTLADSCDSLFSGPSIFSEILKGMKPERREFLSSYSNDYENFVEQRAVVPRNYWYSLFNNLRFRLGLSYNAELRLFDLTENIKIEKINNPAEIERLAAELSLAMFGSRHTVFGYFSRSSDQRFRQSVLTQIAEKILREGLLRAWKNVDHAKPGLWSRFYNSKILSRVLSFPLVKIKDRMISNELMEKVILNGYDAHVPELQIELKTQGLRDTYNSFRNSVRNIFFLTILVSQASFAMESIRETDEMVANMPFAVETKVKNDYKAIWVEQINVARAKFEKIMGRSLTEDEIQELAGRIIVKNGLLGL